MKKSPPKKPLTPFFLFRDKEKAKGNTMGGKEAGEKWSKLSESEKKPFVDAYQKAKEKYDKFLDEQGLSAASSSKGKEKVTSFSTSRVRSICSRKKDILQMDREVYQALAKVLESFMYDIGQAGIEQMKDQDKRTLTYELLCNALDEDKKYNFLSSMKEFEKVKKDLEDEIEEKKAAQAKARKERKKEKKKSEKSEKSDESDSDKEEKKKGSKKKGKAKGKQQQFS